MFRDRMDAGEQLAKKLEQYKGMSAIVYALPRGGVVLGFAIAKALEATLDLVITRKIGHPENPEYAVCAVTEDGELLCNERERASISSEWLKSAAKEQQTEALRRRRVYIPNAQRIPITGKTAIIVDDGIATGLTIRAAVRSIKKDNPKKLVVAIPVAPHDVVETLRKEADEVVVLEDAHAYLGAVGAYYSVFPQVSDGEVIDLLSQNKKRS